MAFIRCAVFLSLFAVSFSVDLSMHSDCGGHATVHSISLEPCSSEPCVIHRGETYTAHINFTAKEHSKTATNVCHGIIRGVEEEFVVTPSDACGYGVHCPIMPGVSQIYMASVTCPTDAPQIRMVGKWQVQDDRGHDIVCFNFPLVIQ